MYYTRKTYSICFHYTIHSEVLSRVSEVRDLGVMFDSSLRFDAHIDQMIMSALHTPRVACRMSRLFSNPKTFFVFYCALARSHLEYASVVWNHLCTSSYFRLERMQNKFVSIYRQRYFRNNSCLLHNDCLMSALHLSSLQQHREKFYLSFFFKPLHGFIDCPDSLAQISLRLPQTATRAPMPRYDPVSSSVYNPVFRMGKAYMVSPVTWTSFVDVKTFFF